jgi:protein prenyltransferase alpha subunit repeat containing protein 1
MLRKELILKGQLSHKDEINFLNVLFTKHPKSGECWSHRYYIASLYYLFSKMTIRRWILEHMKQCGQSLTDRVQEELSICSKVAEIYPKNYYAWTHRIWFMKGMPKDKVCLLDDLYDIQCFIHSIILAIRRYEINGTMD